MIHNLEPYAAYKASGVLWLGVLFGKWLTWRSTFGRLGSAGLSKEAIVVNDQLNSEERDILEKFERGELHPVSNVEHERDQARRATRSTFHKTRRVNLRVTERDFSLAHARAREEGIPIRRYCRASSTNTCQVGWSRRDRGPTKTQGRKNR